MLLPGGIGVASAAAGPDAQGQAMLRQLMGSMAAAAAANGAGGASANGAGLDDGDGAADLSADGPHPIGVELVIDPSEPHPEHCGGDSHQQYARYSCCRRRSNCLRGQNPC